METIVEKLKQLQEKRHLDAQRKYSEIVLRYAHPRGGDAEAIEAAMEELRFDNHRLEHDIHLVRQYHKYLEGDGNPVTKGGRQDAEDIRKGHPDVFLFWDEQDGRKTPLTVQEQGGSKQDHPQGKSHEQKHASPNSQGSSQQ